MLFPNCFRTATPSSPNGPMPETEPNEQPTDPGEPTEPVKDKITMRSEPEVKFDEVWPVFTDGVVRHLRDAVGYNQEQLASMIQWIDTELQPLAVQFILEGDESSMETIRFRLRSKIRQQEYAAHKAFQKAVVSMISESLNIVYAMIA